MNFLFLAVEDELSEVVGRRLIGQVLGREVDVRVQRKNGFGYLKSRLRNFAEIAEHQAVLMITDLDRAACAVSLKKLWFKGIEQPENLIFRVAVKEVESWLLADCDGFSAYLGVSPAVFPHNPDEIADPKALLINIANKAKRPLRADIVPERGSTAVQGIGYNRALCPFVETEWNLEEARQRSDSLERACQRVAELGQKN